jgi:hypothetical protein
VNLLRYSEALDNAAWDKESTTTATAAGDGVFTVVLLANNTYGLQQAVPVTSGATYTYAFDVQADSAVTIQVGNVASGTYANISVTTSWARVGVSQVASSATRYPKIRSAGVSATTIRIRFPQFNEGSTALPYVATTDLQVVTSQPPAVTTLTRGTNVAADTNDPVVRLLGWNFDGVDDRVLALPAKGATWTVINCSSAHCYGVDSASGSFVDGVPVAGAVEFALATAGGYTGILSTFIQQNRVLSPGEHLQNYRTWLRPRINAYGGTLPAVGDPGYFSYYVDQAGGDDEATGTSTATAWKTLAKVNASTFVAGQSIGLKGGETWRETLTVPSSGSAGLPITFGAYGGGAKPVISGADVVTGWSQYSTETLDGSQASSNFYIAHRVANNTASLLGQGFTVSQSAQLSKVTLHLTKAGSPTGNIWATIATGASSPPTTVADGTSGTVDVSTVSGAGGNVTFTFATPPSLTAGTTYWVILNGDYTLSDTNNVTWSLNTTAAYETYSRGNGNSSGFWNAVPNQSYRFSFYILASSSTIWQAADTTEPNLVFFNGTFGTKVASIATVNGAGKWFWAANVLYVYSASDPASTIQAGTRDQCIYNVKDYITIDGLECRYSNSALMSGIASHGGSYVTIKNSLSTYNASYGIVGLGNGSPVTGLLFTNNEVSWNGGNGMSFPNNVDASTISYNVAHDNALILNDTNGPWAGIKMGVGTTVTDSVIEHNVSYNNGTSNPNPDENYLGVGIHLDTVGTGNTVSHNDVYGNLKDGIFIESSAGVNVLYNTSWDNGSIGIELGTGPGGEPTDDHVVAHNTVWGNTFIGIQIRGMSANDAAKCRNNTVQNNIVTGTTSGLNFQAAFGGENDGTNGSGNVYTHNAFGPEAAGFIQWGAGVSKATYAAFATAYGAATNSVTTDPLLTSAATGDFMLATGSPAIGTGVYIAGVSTANPPNIGAK